MSGTSVTQVPNRIIYIIGHTRSLFQWFATPPPLLGRTQQETRNLPSTMAINLIRPALAATAVLALVVTVNGHGAVVFPPPRNAVDKDLKPWSGEVPCSVSQRCPSVETQTGCVCVMRMLACASSSVPPARPETQIKHVCQLLIRKRIRVTSLVACVGSQDRTS